MHADTGGYISHKVDDEDQDDLDDNNVVNLDKLGLWWMLLFLTLSFLTPSVTMSVITTFWR